jgi:hypothetical protein
MSQFVRRICGEVQFVTVAAIYHRTAFCLTPQNRPYCFLAL